MIDVTPSNLWQEIVAGERERERALTNYDKLMAMYEGTGAKATNLVHSYTSAMIPKIVFDNPRVNAISRRQASQTVLDQFKQQLAQAVASGTVDMNSAVEIMRRAVTPSQQANGIKHGLNTWIVKEQYASILDMACFDFLTSFAVLKSSIQPTADGGRWPKSRCVPPTRYCLDPTAVHIHETQWQADWDVMTKSALLALAERDPESYDKQAIEDIGYSGEQKHNVDRMECRVYEIWVRDYTEEGWGGPETGMHGGLFTMACPLTHNRSDDAKAPTTFIRKPRPHYGPKWGPWSLIGAYPRRSSAYPLSPLLATFHQGEALEKHTKAMAVSAAKYKRLVLVSDANPTLAQELRSKPDMFVIQVKNAQFNKDQVVVVEVGGITDEQLKHYTLFRKEYDRAIGMDDAQRGEVEDDATATAVNVADEATANRTAYLTRKFAAGVTQDLRAKAWYMTIDDLVHFGLGEVASEEFGMVSPSFSGGDGVQDFDDLEIDVDPYSMGRTSEQMMQRQVLMAIEMLLTIAPTILQMPYIDWREVARQIGAALNVPAFEDMIDFNMIQQMAQQAQAMGIMPGESMSSDGFERQQADREGQAKGALMDKKHKQDMSKARFQHDSKMKQITATQRAKNKAQGKGRSKAA